MGEALRLYYSLKKLSLKSAHSMQSTAYLMQRLIEDIYIEGKGVSGSMCFRICMM
jgi:hypothetical protein